jgi:hypothetical protein
MPSVRCDSDTIRWGMNGSHWSNQLCYISHSFCMKRNLGCTNNFLKKSFNFWLDLSQFKEISYHLLMQMCQNTRPSRQWLQQKILIKTTKSWYAPSMLFRGMSRNTFDQCYLKMACFYQKRVVSMVWFSGPWKNAWYFERCTKYCLEPLMISFLYFVNTWPIGSLMLPWIMRQCNEHKKNQSAYILAENWNYIWSIHTVSALWGHPVFQPSHHLLNFWLTKRIVLG